METLIFGACDKHVCCVLLTMCMNTHIVFVQHVNPTLHDRSYKQLIHCLVDDDNEFVDEDWEVIARVKTVESVSEFPDGFRPATVYRLCDDHDRVCLYFGEQECEGLDSNQPYSLVDGVLFDSDGDEITLFEPLILNDVVKVSDRELLVDPELQELEDHGGGYLSNDDDDVDSLFTIDGDGDKKIIK